MALAAAADFTLDVTGTGFTDNSVVRWNGSNRPTGFVDTGRLTAAILAADVSALGEYAVTVRDGTAETPPLMFRVVAQVFQIFMPFAAR
jgi:hypothetical protein